VEELESERAGRLTSRRTDLPTPEIGRLAVRLHRVGSRADELTCRHSDACSTCRSRAVGSRADELTCRHVSLLTDRLPPYVGSRADELTCRHG